MSVQFTRRRFITVAAAAVGLPLIMRAGRAEARLAEWHGTTLGAPSTIKLYHNDEAQAQAAIDAALQELARLETIFSVYRADTAISTLNRDGVLNEAPVEFVELLDHALMLSEASHGAYDPTIQPVWQLYFHHFTAANPDPNGPPAADLQAALALVDWQDIKVDRASRRIELTRPGMGLTLNSGAQGYITDRVAAVLRAHGFEKMLVDMGEPRALSTKPDGSAWQIGIANPADNSQAITSVEVVDKCVATSGGYGTLFDEAGNFTHIIDAKTGKTAPAMLGVSVIADTATKADGLATAMLMVPPESRQAMLRAAGGEKAIFVTPNGVLATVVA